MLIAYRDLRSDRRKLWGKTPSGSLKKKKSPPQEILELPINRSWERRWVCPVIPPSYCHTPPQNCFWSLLEREMIVFCSVMGQLSSVTLKTCGTRENSKVLCLAEARHLFLPSFIPTELNKEFFIKWNKNLPGKSC